MNNRDEGMPEIIRMLMEAMGMEAEVVEIPCSPIDYSQVLLQAVKMLYPTYASLCQ